MNVHLLSCMCRMYRKLLQVSCMVSLIISNNFCVKQRLLDWKQLKLQTHPLYLIFQLGAENYSSLSRLLPSLEILSQKHSEVVIQELASNLRAVIATHGAYQPDELTAAARPSAIPAFVRAQKMQTESNDSVTGSQLSSLVDNTLSNAPTTQSASSGRSASALGRKDGGRTSISGGCQQPTTAFTDLLLEACDPDVPTKAVALRSLTKLVQTGNQDAVLAKEKILMVGYVLVNKI